MLAHLDARADDFAEHVRKEADADEEEGGEERLVLVGHDVAEPHRGQRCEGPAFDGRIWTFAGAFRVHATVRRAARASGSSAGTQPADFDRLAAAAWCVAGASGELRVM